MPPPLMGELLMGCHHKIPAGAASIVALVAQDTGFNVDPWVSSFLRIGHYSGQVDQLFISRPFLDGFFFGS
jgi:hypothetical protein